MSTNRITNLQQHKQRERSRRDARMRLIKKYRPLCVSTRFFEYAYLQRWDDETADAAALLMHYWFMRRGKLRDRRWMPMPFQLFRGLFGKHYKRIVDRLLAIGFLEYAEEYGYKKGSHCRLYRLCDALRDDEIAASYFLQSEVLQKRYIANKEHWRRMTVAERQAHAANMIDAACAVPSASGNGKSYYELVERGYLTEVQLATIQRLAKNAHLLKVQIDEHDLAIIVERRYAKKSESKKLLYDIEAYGQKIRDQIHNTLIPKCTIYRNGRFYVPTSNLCKDLWNFAYLNRQQLSEVDIQSSQVYCLLALIKDIAINYFGGTGTHRERLAQCQFSKQIAMIPGLNEHLRRASLIYPAHKHYEFQQHKPVEATQWRKMMYKNFTKFTRLYSNLLTQYEPKIKHTFTLPHHHSINSEAAVNKFTEAGIDEISNILTFRNCIKIDKLMISGCAICSHITHHTNQSDISILAPSIPSESVHSSTQSSDLSSLQTSQSTHLHVNHESVGFEPQVALCQGVMESLIACRFSLKSKDQWERSIADPPLFRNLFFPCPEEISEFEGMLQDDFYTLLMAATGQTLDRNQFKSAFFHFLYRPARVRKDTEWYKEGTTWYQVKTDNPVRKAMEALLPSIVFFLDICKCRPGTLDNRWDYYKWTARAIQSIESQIVLEACANLWTQYPNMFLTTLHDSIKCLPKDVPKVEAELKRTFAKYHVNPQFGRKDHRRPSDFNN